MSTEPTDEISITRNGWIFRVRRVPAGQTLGSEPHWDGTVIGAIGNLTLRGLGAALAKKRPNAWRVGVLRMKDHKVGGFFDVVHEESGLSDRQARTRMDALLARVRAGDFD